MPETVSHLFGSEKSPAKAKHIYTVSEITQDIKLILENTFAEVWVEGEISGVRRIPSGTIFLTLKDDKSILKCVIFYSFASQIKFALKEGLKVICFGHLGLYEKDGQYQLYIENIEPKGIGSLQLALEQLKEKLEKEGLFSPGHKKPIPYLPSSIGVVTSPSGAAIKDILKVLERRFNDTRIIINPVRVQGEGAGKEIAGAVREFNQLNNIEVMIVARGGGSIEDLWAFNEEIVARAIYSSRIPVISAVGHERDWTIADLVADLRAPTPSVAAELVVPKKEDLREKIGGLTDDLNRAFEDIISNFGETAQELRGRLIIYLEHIWKLSLNELVSTENKLALLNPLALIRRYQEKIDALAKDNYLRINHYLRLKESEFTGIIEKVSSLSPLSVLSRGYSITFKMPENEIVKNAKSFKVGDTVKTRLDKGEILSKVTEVNKNG